MFKTISDSLGRPGRRLALAFGLLAAAGAPAWAGTQYPLVLENCGARVVIDHAPRRVVSLGQAQTEILYALGLGERVVGTAVWFGPVAAPYAALNARVKRLADNDPSFEAVLAQEPDLVTAMYEWHIGPHGSVGTRERFAAVKVPAYVSPTDCVGKDNSGGGDGVRRQMYSTDLLYRNIREYGEIFDVAERAEALIAQLQAREAAAVRAIAGLGQGGVSMALWFSSRDIKGDAFLAGRNGVPGYVMAKLGARNVITTEEEWPLVSWERIAALDPEVLVLVKMDRRRFPADDVAAKLAFLRSDPVARQLSAVRHDRIVIVDVNATRPGMDMVDGLETIAKAVAGFGLGR